MTKPSKEQIIRDITNRAFEIVPMGEGARRRNEVTIELAYAAGRKAGMEEAAEMLDCAADNAFTGNMLVWAEKFARAIRAAMEADK